MFDSAAETMSADERAGLQERRLQAMLDRLLAVPGVQADRLAAAGVSAGRDVALADLPRLPTTGKQDLWDGYPWGMLAVPRDQVVALHGSSGTGGRPTLVAYTRADLDLWARMCARSLGCAGATAGSIVHNAYGYGLFTGGIGIHQGAIALGATVVPASGGMTARQITLLRDLQADVLTCTPSYAIHLGEAMQAAGVGPADLALRAGVLGAEPWTEALRTQIESLLEIAALDIYGLSEVIGPGVATECLEGRHGLHVNEDHFLVEVLEVETGQPVADGTVGELTFTTPTKEALPLLRYRTGDLAALERGPCRCGRTLVRMSKVLGRRDDMLVIRGVNVFPSEVEAVLLADGRLAPHYLIVLDARRPTPRLVIACEPQAAGPEDPAQQLTDALRERLGLTCDVRVVPAGTVPRTEVGKAVRVVRWTSGPAPVAGLD
ncbi:MAG: phenylacetate--CoA ligase [Actinomycetota bacterium]|nr:phenylacetate--CoA ligase [Actinomycetota bacterium]